jgi:hypothetical protein
VGWRGGGGGGDLGLVTAVAHSLVLPRGSTECERLCVRVGVAAYHLPGVVCVGRGGGACADAPSTRHPSRLTVRACRQSAGRRVPTCAGSRGRAAPTPSQRGSCHRCAPHAVSPPKRGSTCTAVAPHHLPGVVCARQGMWCACRCAIHAPPVPSDGACVRPVSGASHPDMRGVTGTRPSHSLTARQLSPLRAARYLTAQTTPHLHGRRAAPPAGGGVRQAVDVVRVPMHHPRTTRPG